MQLEVDYDGLEPPIVLFHELAAEGWRPPAAATPPHHAIDWSRPDHERGLDHTIRPWRVVGAVVAPPPGSGPRGAWTDEDATRLLPRLHAVLARHGLHDVERRDADRPSDPPIAPSPRPAPPPPTAATEAPSPSRGPVLATFVVDTEVAPAVRAALEADRWPHRTEAATTSVQQRYRGRSFTTERSAVRFAVALGAEAIGDLEHALDHVGVDRSLARLQIEPLEPGRSDESDLADVVPIDRRRGIA